ncbi:hypothetical protein [Nocardioides ferulae]|uniref:hypothetical protein n=1 Tax=Nocardioides ferulae TaxID=2340821 RepID=UPI000EAF9F1B|nr:hypothetical protein [Nocardioides ferulae]
MVVAPLATEEVYGWEAGLVGEPSGWVLLRWVGPDAISYDDTFGRLLSPDGILGDGFALAPPGVPMVAAAVDSDGGVVAAWQDGAGRVRVHLRAG